MASGVATAAREDVRAESLTSGCWVAALEGLRVLVTVSGITLTWVEMEAHVGCGVDGPG